MAGLLSSVHTAPQEAEVAPIIADHWERASFPHHLVPKIAKLNLGKTAYSASAAKLISILTVLLLEWSTTEASQYRCICGPLSGSVTCLVMKWECL